MKKQINSFQINTTVIIHHNHTQFMQSYIIYTIPSLLPQLAYHTLSKGHEFFLQCFIISPLEQPIIYQITQFQSTHHFPQI